mgnify:FL=1|jgi:hypothetical protein
MEIRNALQKIENYLTVVSNLNKTILSEGTMSRDELLLMKKYLYTSIDRIEDIERSLVIDKREDKSFTPSAPIENTFTPPKQNEIVEVATSAHVEEVEAILENEPEDNNKAQVKEVLPEIVSEDKNEEIVQEVSPPEEELKIEIHPIIEEFKVEQPVEAIAEEKNILADEVVAVQATNIVDVTPMMETVEDDKEVETSTPIAKSFAESFVSEDNSLNTLFGSAVETSNPALVNEQNNTTTVFANIESILPSNANTEINSVEPKEESPTVVQPLIASTENKEKSYVPFMETTENEPNSLVSQFEEKKPISFLDALNETKNDTPLLAAHLEQTLQSSLFTSAEEESIVMEQKTENIEFPISSTTLFAEHHSTLLVEEKEVETIVEEMTPSSLNDIFKPKKSVETFNTSTTQTLSESIALNDKFIFVRELFGNQFNEYENGLKQLEKINSFEAAEGYCKDQLWNKFNWNTKTPTVERFMLILQKRYN